MELTPTFIHAYNCITPLGFSAGENWQNLIKGRSGIKKHRLRQNSEEIYLSKIDDQKLDAAFEQEIAEEGFTRLEKMMLLCLKPVITQHPPQKNSLFILSTTKGNISSLDNCSTAPPNAYLQNTAKKVSDYFGFTKDPVVISNACVSGVMAISVAKNLLQCGKYEDAFIIAADEISEFVVSGFNSFQAMSSQPCKPYDQTRDGITLGEAAAAMYISKIPGWDCFQILGESNINDANHISGPSRTGEGLYRSIRNAFKETQIDTSQIDYVSAHGTATLYNDEMESVAFYRVGLQDTPVNSLKGYFGHTLGAAGLLETLIAIESSRNGLLLKSANLENVGVSHPMNIIRDITEKNISFILKTASGFGGCNSALILKRITGNENG